MPIAPVAYVSHPHSPNLPQNKDCSTQTSQTFDPAAFPTQAMFVAVGAGFGRSGVVPDATTTTTTSTAATAAATAAAAAAATSGCACGCG
jgi:hypothetical protein